MRILKFVFGGMLAGSILVADLGQTIYAATHSTVTKRSTTLPSSFTAAPNGYPVGLFWAVENVMSKHNGYDLTKELGKTVSVYKTDNHFIFKDASGTVVGNDAPTATFEQITHESLTQWIDSHHPAYSQAEIRMSPQKMIKMYYQAINLHNDALAWFYSEPFYAYEMMQSTLQNGLPSRSGWGPNPVDATKQIKVISMKEVATNRHITHAIPTKFFSVTTQGTFSSVGTIFKSGVNTWIVEMAKPSANTPWLVAGTPSGGY